MDDRRRRRQKNIVSSGYNLTVWLVEVLAIIIQVIALVRVILIIEIVVVLVSVKTFCPDADPPQCPGVQNIDLRPRSPPVRAGYVARVQEPGGGNDGGHQGQVELCRQKQQSVRRRRTKCGGPPNLQGTTPNRTEL